MRIERPTPLEKQRLDAETLKKKRAGQANRAAPNDANGNVDHRTFSPAFRSLCGRRVRPVDLRCRGCFSSIAI